jgi:hypothetical protein
LLHNEQEGREIVQIVVEFLEDNLTNKNNVEVFLKVLAELIADYDGGGHFTKNGSGSSEQKSESMNTFEHERSRRGEWEQGLDKNIMRFLGPITKSTSEENINSVMRHSSARKLRFEEIKHKLTTPIIIRSLSYDFGIDLVQKYFPDWLDEEFEKWMSPDHNYCSVLEARLNAALSFAKKKEKGFYKITSNSHAYDLLFMFKLPWVLHVNDGQYPLWVRQKGQSYQFYANFGFMKGGSDQHSSLLINNNNLKIVLGIGTMLVDEEFNFVNSSDNI